MGEHLVEVDGKLEFKSDKYAWCPPGFLALKFTDPLARDLIAEYARRRLPTDPELANDAMAALVEAGLVLYHARCETCQHWAAAKPQGSDRPGAYAETEHRPCGAALHVNYATAADGFVNEKEAPKRRLGVVDAEGYRAEMWTTPDFSCALWESRGRRLSQGELEMMAKVAASTRRSRGGK